VRRAVVLVLLAACRFGFDASSQTGTGEDGGDGDGDGDVTVSLPAIVTPPASCSNGVRDGAERAIDCDGLCERCDACTTSTVTGSSCYCGMEWLSSGPTPAAFSAAYAASPTQAILGGDGGHVLYWDGTRFHHGFVGNGTHEVASGTGPDDIWLAGTEIWHWDGTAWTQHLPPFNVSFNGIHARATNDVWGVSSNGAIYHYDGTTWTIATPYPSNTLLVGVYALSPTDVLIAGFAGTFDHWNGSSLTPASNAFSGIQAIAGVSPTEVYVAGSTTSGTSVFRWNGTNTPVDLNCPLSGYENIASDGPGSVWVSTNSDISHYTGAAWTTTRMPTGYANSLGISNAGRSELAVAGGAVFVADDGKKLAYDSAGWHTTGVTSEDVIGLWGDATQAYAITASSFLHLNGSTVIRDPSPGMTSARVYGFGPNDVWATTNSTAYHYDGSTWTPQGSAAGLIGGSSTADIWAVSTSTNPISARHWTGSMFSDVALPTDFQASDIWALDTNNAWIAGRKVSTNAPALAKWNGATWALMSVPPVTKYLTSVWASSPTDVWVIAITSSTQIVWRYNGSTWTDVTATGPITFADVIRGGPAGIYVWAQERLNKWNGTSWTRVNAGSGGCPSSPTVALWVGDTDVWVGGYFGMLGHYRP
jgi:hypothetical protein